MADIFADDALNAPPPPRAAALDTADDPDLGTLDTGATRTGQIAADWFNSEPAPSTVSIPAVEAPTARPDLLTSAGVGMAVLVLAISAAVLGGLI